MNEIAGNKSPTYQIKRKLGKALFTILKIVYYISTAIIPICVFIKAYSTQSLICSLAIGFISLIIMDIICSILEYCITQISKSISKSKEKKKKKQEEIREKKEIELEQINTDRNNLIKEIEQEEKEYAKSAKELEEVKEKLDEQTYIKLCAVYEKVEHIMRRLKEDIEEYYQIRDRLKVRFSTFRKTTWQYINIAKVAALDEGNKAQYTKLIKKFDNYLDSIKSKLDMSDKKKLNTKMKSLIKEMDTERAKGEWLWEKEELHFG